ncbi:MAG: YjbQ family protein, partial [Acidimicrobiia bacterium]
VDDNAEAHLRSILLGHSATIPLTEGSLSLGQWQRILFVELDGPRTRALQVGLMPTAG